MAQSATLTPTMWQAAATHVCQLWQFHANNRFGRQKLFSVFRAYKFLQFQLYFFLLQIVYFIYNIIFYLIYFFRFSRTIF